MLSIRHGWLVAALAVGLVSTACKKDGKTETAGKAEGGGAAGSSADDLSLLPADSQVVVGINVAQIQASPLWKQFVEPAIQNKMDAGEKAKLEEFKTKCGFDPISSVKSISLGVSNVDASPNAIVVLRGLDKSKSWACIDKMKEEMTKDGSELTKDGDVGLIKSKDGSTVAFLFVNDSTLVLNAGEAGGTAAAVKQAAAGDSALKTSPAFVELYGKINNKDSLWGLVNGNIKAFDQAAAMAGAKPTAVFGSLNVTDGLSMDLRVRMPTTDAAAQLANLGKSQVQQAAQMFDKIDVEADGADVKTTIVLSNQKLQTLIQQFGPMLGAFAK